MEIKRTFDLLANLKQNINKEDILCAKRNGEWVKFSVQEYCDQAQLFSYGLLAKGFKKGDKIASTDLENILKLNSQKVFNTGLFITSDIQCDNQGEVKVLVKDYYVL